MSKKLSPESSVGDLVDYLLEHDICIRIYMADDLMQVIRIRGDHTDVQGKLLECTKYIDASFYAGLSPELRNTIATETINSIVEELTHASIKGDAHDQT